MSRIISAIELAIPATGSPIKKLTTLSKTRSLNSDNKASAQEVVPELAFCNSSSSYVLNDTEIAILNELKLDADQPLTIISKKLKKSVSSIRACVSKLEREGLIRYYPFINVYAIGYANYLFYFTPAPAQEQRLISVLRNDNRVSWLAEFTGSYKFCASFTCRSPVEFNELLISLGRQYSATFSESVTVIQTGLTMFSSKYLAPRNPNYGYVSWKPTKEVVQVDEIDRLILSGLVSLSYSSRRDLARQLSLPHSTVDDRIFALTENGVIAKMVYLPSPHSYGYDVYKIFIKAKSSHPQLRKELFERARTHLQVTVFIECFGAWSFELGVEAKQFEDAQEIAAEFEAHFKKLIEVCAVVERKEKLKESCYPFITGAAS